MKMSIGEKKILFVFGCPNRESTVDRLYQVAHLIPDPAARKAVEALAEKLDSEGVEKWYRCFFYNMKLEMEAYYRHKAKAGQIIEYLEKCSDNMVCSKQLFREALGHSFDEPKQWEIREINDIMNNSVTGWRAFSNPRYFRSPYGRQKGWERIQPDNGGGDFQELTPEEVEQLELPPEWLK